MKKILLSLSVVAVLTAGPALARQDREFPSSSIRPLITNSEAGEANIPREDTGRRAVPVTRTEQPSNQGAYATGSVARDGLGSNSQLTCQTSNSDTNTAQSTEVASEAPRIQSEIPQLRALSRPTRQHSAP